MALVKVTALKNIVIIDPFPIEGVGLVTIQLKGGQYQAYQMYDHQADRLRAHLESAQNLGRILYEIESDGVPPNSKRYAAFTYNDVHPGGRILLGTAPAGTAVSEVTVKITEPFNGYTTISVGDSLLHASLQLITDNNSGEKGIYKVDTDVRFEEEKLLYVYFNGIPTEGAAEIFVYLA
jgi:hypothetical protein